MKKSTQNLLLYIAEAIVNDLGADAEQVGNQDQVKLLGRKVEAMGRYIQGRHAGPGYMKMTKLEFLSLYEGDCEYESYADKADEIGAEGGFL